MASVSHSLASDILSDRPYECPCKKTYKSYPALFTHIKNKHDGNPPGNVKKPTRNPKKLGRPPVNFSKSSIQTQCLLSKSQATIQFSHQQKIVYDTVSSTLQVCIGGIVQILQSLPVQPICRQRLHEITAMMQMTVFMATKRTSQVKKSIGGVLQEFFNAITGRVQWIKFKYFYTLMMLFSQYIIKKTSNSRLFYQGQPDFLCSFINDFVQHQFETMTHEYKIQALSIFKRQYMLQLFYWFFQWMLQKQYTTYRVTFKEDADLYMY